MENPLKYPGVKQILLRGSILLIILLGVNYILQHLFITTTFYDTYFRVSSQFQILPFIQRIIFINAAIFGIIAFLIKNYDSLKKEKIPKFEISQLSFLLFAFSIFTVHYFLKFLIKSFPLFFNSSPLLWGFVKLLLTGIIIISVAVSVFGQKFSINFIKKYYKSLILFALLTLIFFALMFVVQSLWTVFSGGVAGVLNQVFRIFFEDVYYKPDYRAFSLTEGVGPILGVNGFRASMGKPCSGIDSFLLFISLYLLIMIIDWKRINKKMSVPLFFIGAIGMYLTNIFRIFLLFLVGIYISPELAVGIFHTNIGWIMFVLFFFVYWSICAKFLYTKSPNKSKIKNKQIIKK